MFLKTTIALLGVWGWTSAMPLPVLVTEGWLEGHLSENTDRIIVLIGPKVSQPFFNSLNVKLGGLCIINRVPVSTRYLPDEGLAFYPIGNRDFRAAHSLTLTENTFNFTNILDFLDGVTEGNIRLVESSDPTDAVFASLVEDRKIPIVLLDPQSTKRHLVFRAISLRHDFQKEYTFLRFNGTHEQLAIHMRIDRSPEVAAFFYQTPRSDMAPEFDFGITKLSSWMLNKPLNYNNIMWFLKDLARSEIGIEFSAIRDTDKHDNQTTPEEKKNTYETALLEFNIAEKQPLKACQRHLCLLIIDNLHELPKSRFRELTALTRSLQQKPAVKGTKVFLIDNACHKHISMVLKQQTDTFPFILAYDAKKMTLAIFRGNPSFEFLNDWMVSVQEGLVGHFTLSASLTLLQTDCSMAAQKASESFEAQQSSHNVVLNSTEV